MKEQQLLSLRASAVAAAAACGALVAAIDSARACEEAEKTTTAEMSVPSCPKCGAREEALAELSTFESGRKWYCKACGVQF